MAEGHIRVTKLDAARRQLDMAIHMWFRDEDPVSIHTLLYAAHEILHGLSRKRRKGKPLFLDLPIMDERPDIRAKVKDWPNFFKHGRPHELDRVLDFNPEANLVLFSANLAGLDECGAETNALEEAFMLYLLIHHPDFFTLPPETEARRDKSLEQEAGRYTKKQFLKHYLRAFRIFKARKALSHGAHPRKR